MRTTLTGVLLAAALVARVAAQDNSLTLWYPRDPVQCLPSNITISGAAPPYYLRATPGSLTSAAPLVDFGQITSSAPIELFWIVNLAYGTNFTLLLTTSSTGETSQSPMLTVKYSADTSCLNAPASLYPIPTQAGGPGYTSTVASAVSASASSKSTSTSAAGARTSSAGPTTGSGPGTGAFVGIAIGAVALALLVAFVVWFLIRRKRRNQPPKHTADLDGPGASPGGYEAVSTYVPTPFTSPELEGSRPSKTVTTTGTNMESAYSYPVTYTDQMRSNDGRSEGQATSTSISRTALARNMCDSARSTSSGAVTPHHHLSTPPHPGMTSATTATTLTTLSSSSNASGTASPRSSKLSPPIQVPAARTEYIQEEDAGAVPPPAPTPEVRREIVPPSYNEAWAKPGDHR